MRIKQNGQWVQVFTVGKDGITPHIGENGNWWFDEEDSGVAAGYSGPVLPAGILENGEYINWTRQDDEYYIEKQFFGLNSDLSAIVITEDFEVNRAECLDGKLQIFVSAPPSQDIPFTVAFVQREKELEKIEIVEEADGSVTMTNTWKDSGQEVVVIKADEEGNPSGMIYNGIEISVTFTRVAVE